MQVTEMPTKNWFRRKGIIWAHVPENNRSPNAFKAQRTLLTASLVSAFYCVDINLGLHGFMVTTVSVSQVQGT